MSEKIDEIGLVVQLVAATFNSTASMTELVMDHQAREIKRLKAELSAIRYCINECFSTPYMPREGTILDAIYPSLDLIESFIKDS